MFTRLIFCISMLITVCQAQEKITVAVAANMQYTIRELITAFNKQHPVKVDVVLGASGHLARQAMHGASFDVFISADKAYPYRLFTEKLTVEQPKIYAAGILVLWSLRADLRSAKDLQILLQQNVTHIAIANPKTAPYGAAAESILKKYGLYQQVSSKLVTGENITQASQFVLTQNADLGFTAKAIVISGENKGKGNWVELNPADYPPIEQYAALLKSANTKTAANARLFYDFLFSQQAKVIYNKYGYIVK